MRSTDQVDIQCSGHGLCSSFAGDDGGVSVSWIPRVCRTVSALPISQVSLPFSRSMTNRETGSRSEGQGLLRDTESPLGSADSASQLFSGVFH